MTLPMNLAFRKMARIFNMHKIRQIRFLDVICSHSTNTKCKCISFSCEYLLKLNIFRFGTRGQWVNGISTQRPKLNLLQIFIWFSGKVFVHCHQGISRSATLVLAYLMIYKRMTAKQAVQIVRKKREIYPNEGFFEQLSDLELRLRATSTHRIYA